MADIATPQHTPLQSCYLDKALAKDDKNRREVARHMRSMHRLRHREIVSPRRRKLGDIDHPNSAKRMSGFVIGLISSTDGSDKLIDNSRF